MSDFLEFYGFKEDPFKITPDPAYYYPSSGHNTGLSILDYSVQQKEGFSLITGEPGTGKTTLLKVFLEKWKNKAETAMVLTSKLPPDDFLCAVLDDFGLNYEGFTNKNDLMRYFRDFLIEKSNEGKTVIIIVDEAQLLPFPTLEELRVLSNLETHDHKLLHIILIAQPELDARLRASDLRQLNQRIITRHKLFPLSRGETVNYINFRLNQAGRTLVKFDDNALNVVYKLTGGVPRNINILSNRALMSAYLDEGHIISKKHVAYASKSIDYKVSASKGSKILMTLAVLAPILIILSGLYFGFIKEKPTTPAGNDVAVNRIMKDTRLETDFPEQSEKKAENSELSDKDIIENKENVKAERIEDALIDKDRTGGIKEESVPQSADTGKAVDIKSPSPDNTESDNESNFTTSGNDIIKEVEKKTEASYPVAEQAQPLHPPPSVSKESARQEGKSDIIKEEDNNKVDSAKVNVYYAVVRTFAANIRALPGVDAEKIAFKKRGDRLLILGVARDKKGNKWFKVDLKEKGAGWVAEGIVDVNIEKL